MNASEQQRRSFLFSIGALGMSQVFAQSLMGAEAEKRRGFVLGSPEGEHLVHFRDHGNIMIKVGAATGSDHLALGTQQLMAGSGIPIHRHFQMDEAFYVLEGSGIFILNDVRHSFEKGATIFIPKNNWHGFENPDHELLLLWIVSPAGLDGFFRDTCNPPGIPPKQLTREQIREIGLKYATEFRECRAVQISGEVCPCNGTALKRTTYSRIIEPRAERRGRAMSFSFSTFMIILFASIAALA